MEKKIKKLDLAALLTTVLWIGAIIFIVLMFIFGKQTNQDEKLKAIVTIIFVCACVFFGFALVSTIIISVIGIKTDWKNPAIQKQSKLLFCLNFVPLFLSIPANIIIRKLVKSLDQPQEEYKPLTSNNQQPQQQTVVTTTTTTTSSTATNKYPVNEPFFYNEKWMYYDGSVYYEANENNEWVPSNVIPK